MCATLLLHPRFIAVFPSSLRLSPGGRCDSGNAKENAGTMRGVMFRTDVPTIPSCARHSKHMLYEYFCESIMKKASKGNKSTPLPDAHSPGSLCPHGRCRLALLPGTFPKPSLYPSLLNAYNSPIMILHWLR